MTLSNHRDMYDPQTPRTPLFSPFPISTSVSRNAINCKMVSREHTPSSLTGYPLGLSTACAEQRSTWSPTCVSYPNVGVQAPFWTPFSPGAIGQERGASKPLPYRQEPGISHHSGLSKLGGRQHDNFTSGHHNVVDVNRIRDGIDVRTTVSYFCVDARLLISNGADHVTKYPQQNRSSIRYLYLITPKAYGIQAMLKSIVDETSFAKYDFMYLRIGVLSSSLHSIHS